MSVIPLDHNVLVAMKGGASALPIVYRRGPGSSANAVESGPYFLRLAISSSVVLRVTNSYSNA
jgi:hypothetical protein